MQDELKLLSRARALDEDALTQIHDRYYEAIFRYISFRVSNVQSVEDLTGEVFVRFLHALRNKSAPQNTIRGWLYGTASHVVKEHYRREGRATMTPLNEGIADEQVDLAATAQADIDKESLQKGLTELTDQQQHVLAMRFGQGMAIREVAEIMNKSQGSIKMLQARAIAALGQKLSRKEAGG